MMSPATCSSDSIDELSICGSDRLDYTLRTEDTSSLTNEDLIGKKETNAVNFTKYLVMIAIIVATLSLAVVAFFTTANEERHNFEAEFDSYSDAVIEVSNRNARSIFRAIESLSFAVTSYTVNNHAVWPYVTFPSFEKQGQFACDLSGSVFVSFSPFVTEQQRESWGKYSSSKQRWIHDALEIQANGINTGHMVKPDLIYDKIYHVDGSYKDDGKSIHQIDEIGAEHYAPIWQVAPVVHDSSYINFNLLRHPAIPKFTNGMIEARRAVMSSLAPFGNAVDHLEHIRNKASKVYAGKKQLLLRGRRSLQDNGDKMKSEFPHTMLFQPTFDDTSAETSNVAGFVMAVFPWDNYFKNILKVGVNGIVVVADDSCGRIFSFQINGPDIQYLGLGDSHKSKYDHMSKTYDFAPFASYNSSTFSSCDYVIRVYPSEEMEMKYHTSRPIMYTLLVILSFLCTAAFFVTYDRKVQQRQNRVLTAAIRSDKIVSSLFPSNVRERVMESADSNNENQKGYWNDGGSSTTIGSKKACILGSTMKFELKNFLVDDRTATIDDTCNSATAKDKTGGPAFSGQPIADLFPDCTVMFADMVGFTAWSSLREPCQVFTLLETVYHAFDKIAKKRQVFKVETVGDSYVAVAGLPDPRVDHAVVMAKFTRDCLVKFEKVVADLELILGPGTKNLSMRFGLHSGPVTAGVLRGERSRFQLFGDTMNTSSRMESTGTKNRIQVSEDTAQLLDNAGKVHWLRPRKDVVSVKGKGEMRTFWLEIDGVGAASHNHSNRSKKTGVNNLRPIDCSDQHQALPDNHQIDMLATWNKDLLLKLLRQIVARRECYSASTKFSKDLRISSKLKSYKRSNSNVASSTDISLAARTEGSMVLDEVQEVINLPKFDAARASTFKIENPESVVLGDKVEDQMLEYVRTIASMYRKNAFHNFEHATHVTMAVVKTLSRIVAPDINIELVGSEHIASHLHDHTYGITSDPLTQFAVVFSALIHDADHTGVPNTQLIKENPNMAAIYKEKSVAEQNSIDLSWNLFMEDRFQDFREALCSTREELQRFRQIVVNSVIATDIMDADQRNFRQKRWDRAFKKHDDGMIDHSYDVEDDVNRKATIVIEHLIQASDVAHTMQHWHVYRTWNERLFREMYSAYKNGRATKNPAEFWYKGEIGFFDFYIIPLAKKLKDCGVFGVSSAECLDYAVKNRDEWTKKGEAIVAEMVKSIEENDEITRKESQENLLTLLQHERDEAQAVA